MSDKLYSPEALDAKGKGKPLGKINHVRIKMSLLKGFIYRLFKRIFFSRK